MRHKTHMEIPPVSVRRLRILDDEEIGVFGYFASHLDSIVNVSGRRITCTVVLGPIDSRLISLDEGERYAICLDTETCIRRRFMPHIRTTETVEFDVVWHHDQGRPHPETPARRAARRVWQFVCSPHLAAAGMRASSVQGRRDASTCADGCRVLPRVGAVDRDEIYRDIRSHPLGRIDG